MTDWIAADWPAPQGIVAGSTLRSGGVSEGAFATLNLGAHVGDDPVAVAENRRRFLQMCALGQEPDWLTQVHGTDVHIAGQGEAGEADAVIGRAGTVAVLTADCLPILLCARSGDEFAAIHGGWRGLAAGIVNATVSRMHTPPEQLLAWLGPAISQPAFEVGGEVFEAFLDLDAENDGCFEPNDRGRWMQIVIHLVTESSPGASDGLAELWRRWDGETGFTRFDSVADLPLRLPDSGVQGWWQGYILGWANAAYAEDTEWLVDEVTFSDTSLLDVVEIAPPMPPPSIQ